VSKKSRNRSEDLQQKFEWQIGVSHFYIDKRIATCTAPTKNPLATHGKELGTLMTAYGLVKGSSGITTVGVTTMSQPNRNEKGWTVHWKDVREVKTNPAEYSIMLKEKLFTGGLGGGLGSYHIQCTIENYEAVLSTCQTFHSRASKKAVS
jgi:hypothetical protein